MHLLQTLRFRFRRWRLKQEADDLMEDMAHHLCAQADHAEAWYSTRVRWLEVQKQLTPGDTVLAHFGSPEHATRLARKLLHSRHRRDPDSAA